MPTRAAATLACLAIALSAAGCGDDEDTTSKARADASLSSSAEPSETVPDTTEADEKAPKGEPGGGDGHAKPPAKPKPEATEADKADATAGAERSYSDYVEAINAKDGEALCALLPPGVERELKPPIDEGDCAGSLSASIGYEDPRGYPVWTETTLNGVDEVSIGDDPSTARLTAAIVTGFEGREPSVESDIAYLERAGGEWRLAQPTGALYRAIGRPELPPSVIAPPGG